MRTPARFYGLNIHEGLIAASAATRARGTSRQQASEKKTKQTTGNRFDLQSAIDLMVVSIPHFASLTKTGQRAHFFALLFFIVDCVAPGTE